MVNLDYILFSFIKNGELSLLELESSGFDIQYKNKNNKTILDLLIAKDIPEIILFLIERGANVNYKNFYGYTSIYIASIEDDVKLGELLLKCGADLNLSDYHNNTPLHMAVIHGNKNFTELLLENGADLNSKDFNGNTALHFSDHYEISELLLEYGANPNIPNNLNETFFQKAIQRNNKKVINLINEHVEKEITNALVENLSLF